MKSSIKSALEKQGTHELLAANAYTALHFWCADNDYNGFAEFFKKQADEEREHAEKFFDHVLDRGALPLIGAIAAPKAEFDSLVEVAETALALEVSNTKGIVECFELAQSEKDYASFNMLQWFIDEQVEEESWASTMVTLTRRAQCSGALLYLDRHINKELGD